MRPSFLLVLLSLLSTFRADSMIIYTSGSSFSIPNYFKSTPLDLNDDGTADVMFDGEVHSFDISGANGSELLDSGEYAQVLSPGDVIGVSPDWSAAVTWLAESTSAGWTGPLSTKGEGYLGIQFNASDGLHYGWVHLRLPQVGDISFAPVVVDWAYESTPNKPIVAGAKPIYFTVNFGRINGLPRYRNLPLGGGVFMLETNADGCTLYYDLQLQTSLKPIRAAIYVETNPQSGPGCLLADLGAYSITNEPPIVLSTSGDVSFGNPQSISLPFLVYRGEIRLDARQLTELIRSQLSVEVEYKLNRPYNFKGEITRRILPFN